MLQILVATPTPILGKSSGHSLMSNKSHVSHACISCNLLKKINFDTFLYVFKALVSETPLSLKSVSGISLHNGMISSLNAFCLFLPLFKHQTTPYNVLFFQKWKNIPFIFLFKQEEEVSGRGLTTTTKSHVHDVCNPDSLHTVFYLIYHFYHIYLCNKCYQTSPIYTLLSLS